MTRCCVAGCDNDWKKTLGISFHKFPKKTELKRQWIKGLKLPTNFAVSQSTVVCSEHFRAEDFDKSSSRVTLVPDAVPSEFQDESDVPTSSSESETEDILTELAQNKNKPKVNSSGQSTCIMLADDKKTPTEGGKNSSYLLVTVPCGKSLKDESPLNRKLRLEIIYNREVVQIKSRIINNLYKQNSKLRERIGKTKSLLKELEKKQLNEGGLCYAERK